MVLITFTISENTIEVTSMDAGYEDIPITETVTYSYDNYINKTNVDVASSNTTDSYGIKDLVINIYGNTYTWSGNANNFITVGNTLTYTGPILEHLRIS